MSTKKFGTVLAALAMISLLLAACSPQVAATQTGTPISGMGTPVLAANSSVKNA